MIGQRPIADRVVGDSLTVELSALDRAVLVRIQVPQPNLAFRRNAAVTRVLVDGKNGCFLEVVNGLPEVAVA